MPHPRVHRVVVLGDGTGVGKTHLTRALAAALRARRDPSSVLALKPIETGRPWDDARALALNNPFHVQPHPLHAFEEPVSPHIAARRAGITLSSREVARWLEAHEAELATRCHMLPYACWVLVETAGGVFSPLSPTERNRELAAALDPALWVLVASDRLGVLHSLTATLTALQSLGRVPDYVVLSAASEPDASTGSNAAELRLLGVADPALALGRQDDDAGALADALLARVAAG